MKTTAKNAIREESGKILILVLVLLVVGGLLLTPLLGLMSTGLASGQVYERKAAELYAADAGVEDAIWRIQNDKTDFDADGYYSYPDRDNGVAEVWVVNDKSVEVEIYRTKIDGSSPCHIVHMYQILSRADDGATTVEAFLRSLDLDYSALAGRVITSGGDVTIRGQQSLIEGDILLAPKPDGVLWPEGFEDTYDNGKVIRDVLSWPKEGELIEFYLRDVNVKKPHTSGSIDLRGVNDSRGPLYVDVDGPLFSIMNSLNPEATLQLTGTLYITTDTLIKSTKNMILDLNTHTLFVNSDSTGAKNALEIGSGVAVKGPGAIIAIGDIKFEPNRDAGGTGPVLLYSISGQVDFRPGTSFYGSVVADDKVSVQSGHTLIYPEGGFGRINFPGFIEGKEVYTIQSWSIV